MKRTLLNLMRVTGAFAPFRLANRSRALVLTYHRFGAEGDGAATSARAFEEQLKYLRSRYQIVPLSSIARACAGGGSLPRAAVAITIDDGYRDAYEIAFPILRRYNSPATLFAVTRFLDRKTWLWTDKLRFLTSRTRLTQVEVKVAGLSIDLRLGGRDSRLEAAGRVNSALKLMADDEKDGLIHDLAGEFGVALPDSPPAEFAPITWDEAREMDRAGVEIGSHTLAHPILTQVGNERLRAELGRSKSRLEEMLDREIDMFCYPNGDYDAGVRSEVERAGYACAVTTEIGLNSSISDPLALKRIHTEQDLAHFAQSTSGFSQIKDRLRGTRGAAHASLQARRGGDRGAEFNERML